MRRNLTSKESVKCYYFIILNLDSIFFTYNYYYYIMYNDQYIDLF